MVASAYATPEVKTAIENGELLGLFVKPYSVDHFLARISDVFARGTITAASQQRLGSAGR
jgi:hypothetical protein